MANGNSGSVVNETSWITIGFLAVEFGVCFLKNGSFSIMQLFASYRCVFREDGIDFFELHQVFCSIQILSRLTTVSRKEQG